MRDGRVGEEPERAGVESMRVRAEWEEVEEVVGKRIELVWEEWEGGGLPARTVESEVLTRRGVVVLVRLVNPRPIPPLVLPTTLLDLLDGVSKPTSVESGERTKLDSRRPAAGEGEADPALLLLVKGDRPE